MIDLFSIETLVIPGFQINCLLSQKSNIYYSCVCFKAIVWKSEWHNLTQKGENIAVLLNLAWTNKFIFCNWFIALLMRKSKVGSGSHNSPQIQCFALNCKIIKKSCVRIYCRQNGKHLIIYCLNVSLEITIWQ